jgi:hypothetical protein
MRRTFGQPRENAMTDRLNSKPLIIAGIAVAIAVGAFAIWATPSVSPLSPAANWFGEEFRNAHLDYLPVQEFDDQTFVFTRTAQR